MRIISLSENSVAVLIEKQELTDTLDTGTAALLARHAMTSAGISPGKKLEIDMVDSGAGIMLFVRKRMLQCCAFDDFEALLSMLRLLEPDGITADIISYNGRWYILSEEAELLREWEPAERIFLSENQAALLREHGEVILEQGKTGKILSYFV